LNKASGRLPTLTHVILCRYGLASRKGAALINILDPEIFPYTKVNGSGADATLKSNTPQVGSPSYATDIISFINQNVPIHSIGSRCISCRRSLPSRAHDLGSSDLESRVRPGQFELRLQRFQRGVIHYFAGTGTESILLADYLKAIVINQNAPLTCCNSRARRGSSISIAQLRRCHCAAPTSCQVPT
jgi:hypothetical protein